MSINERLYDRAFQAITDLYSDKSVSSQTCLENMQTLTDEIATLIEAIQYDIEQEEVDRAKEEADDL